MPRVNDKGFKALLMNLKDLESTVIEAGIFGDAKAKKSKSKKGSRADNLAYRLKIHDQGLGNNPKREVLQPALDKFTKDFESSLEGHFKRLDKSGEVDRAAKSAGQRLAAQIKVQFIKTKPKKASTIAAAQRKYGGGPKDAPLVQTNEMRSAVTYKVSK